MNYIPRKLATITNCRENRKTILKVGEEITDVEDINKCHNISIIGVTDMKEKVYT